MHQTKPALIQVHPAPKTATREPTSAEFEQLGRTVFADMTRLNELSLETARVRSHMAQAVSALTYRTGPGVVEVCSLCGLAHIGECLNA